MNIIRLVSALEFDLSIRSQNTRGMTVKVTICEVGEPMSWISFSFVSHNNINHRLSRSKYYHRCACEDNCHTHASACMWSVFKFSINSDVPATFDEECVS